MDVIAECANGEDAIRVIGAESPDQAEWDAARTDEEIRRKWHFENERGTAPAQENGDPGNDLR